MTRVPGTLFAKNLVERRGLIFQLVRRDGHEFVSNGYGLTQLQVPFQQSLLHALMVGDVAND